MARPGVLHCFAESVPHRQGDLVLEPLPGAIGIWQVIRVRAHRECSRWNRQPHPDHHQWEDAFESHSLPVEAMAKSHPCQGGLHARIERDQSRVGRSWCIKDWGCDLILSPLALNVAVKPTDPRKGQLMALDHEWGKPHL